MKSKEKPGSKIPAAKTNTKIKIDSSLLKKNEFALILIGALLLTIIIFFLFFNSSDSVNEPVEKSISSTSFADLEKRVEKIEQTLQINENSSGSAEEKDIQGIDPLEERMLRLETAFLVKFDSLIERMGKIENSISLLKNRAVPAAITKKTVAKKPATPVKKAVKKVKKASIFHTVQKGETLYYISKKYNTSVATLRKLNKLSSKAKIYPGDNILIR